MAMSKFQVRIAPRRLALLRQAETTIYTRRWARILRLVPRRDRPAATVENGQRDIMFLRTGDILLP